ncbi:MAG: PIN domain-containing protein [Acidobacteriaceae bacterium]
MKVALDTNILVYAEGVNDAARRRVAWDLIEKLPADAVIPVQALGELFQVLVRKAGRTPADARAAISRWSYAFPLAETSASVLLAATDLATRQFSLWDAVILSAAAEAGCQLLLSEDMQPGFIWRGLTIVNPFAAPRDALLDEALLRH